MYKGNKTLSRDRVFKNYKVKIISITLTISVVIILTIMKIAGHSHDQYLTENNSKIEIDSQGINDGNQENIDTTMDSKVIGSISKQSIIQTNQAQFLHRGGEADKHITTLTTPSARQFPTVSPTVIMTSKESTQPDSSNSRVVVLNQSSESGAIKVVDRIDVSMR